MTTITKENHMPDQTTTGRRERFAAAIRDNDGWVLDEGQHVLDAVVAVADAEQAAAVRRALEDVARKAPDLRNFEKTTGPRAAAVISENVGVLRVSDWLWAQATAVASRAPEEHTDLPSRAFMESRCLLPPRGCGRPRDGRDEAGPRETEWVRTGLCPDCQGAPTPVNTADAPS